MKTKIALSMIVILFVIAASLGATFAWFTDASEIPGNTFEAGTVLIDADEELSEGWEDNKWDNWNPGDCTDKKVNVKVTGTKGTLVRAQVIESWTFKYQTEEINGKLYVIKDGDGEPKPLVDGPETVERPVDGSSWEYKGVDLSNIATMNISTDWTYVDGNETNLEDSDKAKYWYYLDQVLRKDTDGYEEEMIFFTEVCFSEDADNLFQGAEYVVSVKFEAVQASNNASGSEWGVNSSYNNAPPEPESYEYWANFIY